MKHEILPVRLDIIDESERAVMVKVADLEVDGQSYPLTIWLPKSQIEVDGQSYSLTIWLPKSQIKVLGERVTGITRFMFESMLGTFRPCRIGQKP